MKLKQLDQYIDFIETVQACEADVYFCSEEGDRLNLKSTLSQFLFVSVFRDRAYLLGGSIVCRNEADYRLLAPYLEEADSEEETAHE